ncbi:FecR family protein [Leptospira sp. GIMC2001]|uniref:FecR family protein n=1 Tax=Leptospira sp. GIMC2001 TaxID=1513297 RepID=UPI002349DB9C|nr:FecR family protein [Leptospira sp. GIMC2001]WCL48364.1 FecR family protein [Leptospira sp. GIMC2001]
MKNVRRKEMSGLLLAVLVLVLSVAHVIGQSNNDATVSFVIGKTFVKPSKTSKWNPLKLGDKIPEGSLVKAGNGSRLTVLFKGSEFKIAPNTELEISSFPDGKKDGSVDLKSGFAWFKLSNLGDTKFTAKTPTSTAGVRGTAFATMYSAKEKMAMNCICEGKVEIGNSAGSKSELVKAGSGTSIRPNGDIDISSYKDDLSKNVANPSFAKKIKAAPVLANCLSCHTPKGWDYKGVVRDETYGK